jgi:signal transduction histidine kinase/HPt (histidine-containing phosphotransfer) domain-containing protein
MKRPVRRLLIVDDDSVDLRQFCRLLKKGHRHDYEIVTAMDGGEAMAAVDAQRFDCILLDLHLPDISGLDFMTELTMRADDPSCAIIIVTGQVSQADAIDAMKRGAHDYLGKDELNRERLIAAIDNSIEKANLRNETESSHRATFDVNKQLAIEIEDRKRAEQEADEARLLAEQASQAKSSFLAHMSHELRTPMNGVIGMTALLMSTEMTSEQSEYALAIKRSGLHLLDLLNDILDLSKLEARCIELEQLPFDLEELIDETVEMVARKAAEKDVELCVMIDDSARRRFIGDPTRLRQVVLNLVGNAVKFTDVGHVTVTALADVAGDGDPTAGPSLRIEVTDTGVGMNEEAIGRLFETFRQADSSITRRFGGTGLGLAISRQLVELMGGAIDVKSTAGQGSTFAIELPMPRTDDIPVQPAAADALSGHRILVVDDFALSRGALKLQLERLGAVVKETEDGYSAVAELRRAEASGAGYDLALIDQVMPRMRGEALAKEIGTHPELAGLKIVLMSAIGVSSKIKDGERTLIHAVLSKPLSQRALINGLIRVLAPDSVQPVGACDTELAAAVAPDAAPRRVLLVEDNPINQQVAAGILKKSHFAVDVVEDGVEAIEAAGKTAYDLILMDLQMPNMGGVEATQRIRAMVGLSRVPIVAMTAHAMAGIREECLAAGMDDCITKPFDPRDFISVVRRWTSWQDANVAPPDNAPKKEDNAVIIDEQLFEALAQSMEPADFHALIARTPGRLQTRLDSLGISVRQGADLAAVAREAHSLIGAAGNVGGQALSLLARQLEEGAIQSDGASVAKLIDDIDRAGALTIAALRAKADVLGARRRLGVAARRAQGRVIRPAERRPLRRRSARALAPAAFPRGRPRPAPSDVLTSVKLLSDKGPRERACKARVRRKHVGRHVQCRGKYHRRGQQYRPGEDHARVPRHERPRHRQPRFPRHYLRHRQAFRHQDAA